MTASIIFTLPAADGTSGQFLATDGSGSLSWSSQSAQLVTSVAGRTGVITLTTSDVTEGSNAYYSDARSRSAVSANSPLNYNSSTGSITIAVAGASSQGYLSSADWGTFKGRQSALTVAGSGSSGILASSDWLTFNSKQSAINAGTTGQYFRGDKSWQDLTTAVVSEITNLYYTDSRARAAVSGRKILSWAATADCGALLTRSLLERAVTFTSDFYPQAIPLVMVDSGTENLNNEVVSLMQVGLIERVIAQIEIDFSNSMIEAFFRTIKHRWLYLVSLATFSAAHSAIEKYMTDYNHLIPLHALSGGTPILCNSKRDKPTTRRPAAYAANNPPNSIQS